MKIWYAFLMTATNAKLPHQLTEVPYILVILFRQMNNHGVTFIGFLLRRSLPFLPLFIRPVPEPIASIIPEPVDPIKPEPIDPIKPEPLPITIEPVDVTKVPVIAIAKETIHDLLLQHHP